MVRSKKSCTVSFEIDKNLVMGNNQRGGGGEGGGGGDTYLSASRGTPGLLLTGAMLVSSFDEVYISTRQP